MAMITNLALSLLLAPQAFTLTPQVKDETLNVLFKEMSDRYVMPEISKKIEGELKTWMKSKEYGELSDPAVFSAKVNEFIKSQVTDAHLRFRYHPNTLPARQNRAEPSAEEIKRAEEETRFVNANFEKVERLRGNVGYISFNGFASPEDMARPVQGAMTFLGNVDAMIVDLSNNGGGDPAGVQLFCSYFFEPKPVLLNTIYFRPSNSTREFWTLEKVEGPRLPSVPLFVLVSKRTGSGAEECAYNFQQLKRGTIIGEPTWGGANPGGVVRLSDHFSCFIPTGRAINPYSKTNWEGKGVQPDIALAPADSLKHAQLLSIKAMIEKATDPEKKADLQGIYNQVEKGS